MYYNEMKIKRNIESFIQCNLFKENEFSVGNKIRQQNCVTL